MRRVMVVVAVVAMLAGTAATAMAATGEIKLGRPRVTEPTDVSVHVERDDLTGVVGGLLGGGNSDCGEPLDLGDATFEPICSVSLKMFRTAGSTRVASQARQLECTSRCDTRDPVYGPISLDPSTTAPFEGIPAKERCNGKWMLQAAISGGNGEETSQRPAVLSGPPTAPRQVAVEPGAGAAKVSWKPAPQGDVTGYRLQRRADGGWKEAAVVGGDGTSYVDRDAPAGKVDYRVETLRADGFVPVANPAPGEPERVPVGQCGKDDGLDLSSADHPDKAQRYGTGSTKVRAASDGESTGFEGGSGGGGGGGGGILSGSTGGLITNPATDTGGDGDGGGDSGDGSGGSSSEIEQLPAYGEGLGFNRQLDFGDTPSPSQTPTEPGDQVVLEDNLASGGVERYLDTERIAVPVALGLILVVLGAHLRAWMNVALPAGSSTEGSSSEELTGGDDDTEWWTGDD